MNGRRRVPGRRLAATHRQGQRTGKVNRVQFRLPRAPLAAKILNRRDANARNRPRTLPGRNDPNLPIIGRDRVKKTPTKPDQEGP